MLSSLVLCAPLLYALGHNYPVALDFRWFLCQLSTDFHEISQTQIFKTTLAALNIYIHYIVLKIDGLTFEILHIIIFLSCSKLQLMMSLLWEEPSECWEWDNGIRISY